MSAVVAALYLGGPFDGQIHQIPADARRQQHVMTPAMEAFSYAAQMPGDFPPPPKYRTELVRYFLCDELFEDTVMCAEGMNYDEVITAYERWRADQ